MSQYRTGTVAVTNNSNAVVGSGTAWLANIAAGHLFTPSGSLVPYIVANVVDDANLTLSSLYGGTTQSGLLYSITTSKTPTLGIPYMEDRDIDTATIFKRAMQLIETLLTATGLFGQSLNAGDLVENAFINGDMDHAQRGASGAASFAAVASGTYTLDRFLYEKAGTMVHTISQDADVPTVAQAGRLFTSSLRLNLTTADTAIAAGDFCTFTQRIEGYNFKRTLAQRPMTYRTWVKATLAGVYCVAFRNSGPDRSFVAEITINNANTWEEKVVTILASPSAGTWNYANGMGLSATLVIAGGSTFQTAAGAWQNGNFFATANQINGVNTGSTDFRTTGWELVPGIVPMRLPPRSVVRELLACRRYYRKTFPQATAPAQNAGTTGALALQAAAATANGCSLWDAFDVLMRAAPTVTTFNPSAANANWRDTTGAVDRAATVINASEHGVGIYISATPTAGNTHQIHATADAEL